MLSDEKFTVALKTDFFYKYQQRI